MKGYRYDYRKRRWIKSTRLPRESKAWLSTVKGRAKRALKHLLLAAK